MPTPQASNDLYRTLQRLQLVLVAAGRRAWSRMSNDFDTSWQQVAPPLVQVTSAAQFAAATAAAAYVPAVLEETGQPDLPEARVRPRAFAGVASDGRSLAGLLTGAVGHAKMASGRGLAPNAALDVGGAWLDGLLQTVVADAARDATAAEIVVRPDMGWVRMVNPPCCSRCAVLAGKWYRWNDGFPRHPRCDCVHIPTAEDLAGDYVTDPQELVRRGLITDLSQTQQKRLADGADLPKVLNESRDRWRERMAADRRAARRASYTPAELRAADRRAQRRTTWGTDTAPVIPRSPAEFMAHLTNRVDAINAMRTAGIVS